MSETLKDRFYTAVAIEENALGYAITLDGRSPKSPGGKALTIPTRVLAQHIGQEWDAQDPKIDLNTMPLTRLVFSALDQVANHRDHVVGEVSAYAATDLLCYRADGPRELIAKQQDVWDPICAWCAETFDAPLVCVSGIMAAEQPQVSLANLRQAITEKDDFTLAALHMATKMTGSLVLALAVAHGYLTKDAAWAASRLDEDWQAEKWGQDEEANILAAQKQADFFAAAIFLDSLR